MNLATALELSAHRYPDAEAIITPDTGYTYRQWNSRVNSVARALLETGLRPGDRIAICAANGEAPATTYFALHKMGAVAVWLNARWKRETLAYAMRESAAKAVLCDAGTYGEVSGALSLCERAQAASIISIYTGPGYMPAGSGTVLSYETLAGSPTDAAPAVPRRIDETATVLYTSGTTGRPKGVCRSCRSDYYAALAIILEHGWRRFERILGIMPLYHTMGLHTLISMVLLNGACLLMPHFDAAEVCKLIAARRITALYLVPTVFYDLVQHLDSKGEIRPVSRLAFAGAPMPVSLVERCREAFRPHIFVNHYGCTEMLAIAVNPFLDRKPASAGRPALHSRVRIVTADRNREVSPGETVAPGETGEIIVDASSPQAFTGYLLNPAAYARAVREGWYFTGDLGFHDDEGDLYLAGRVDDMIISGGENIYPGEVEEVLLSHPLVKEAAVVGLPHERWGQMVTAFIVPEADHRLDAAMLERFCRENPSLARYQRPRRFIFVREIPKSATGKVLYQLLRKSYPPAGDHSGGGEN